MNRDEFYTAFKHDIITSKLRPGELLKEKQIMQDYGIGRLPMREIMVRLQQENLIETIPRMGTGVTRLDIKHMRDVVELRLELECVGAKLAAENVLCYVLLRILELLHPFMPFITEEIWQALPHEGDYLIRAKWPEYHSAFDFRAEEQAMEEVKDAIYAVRARRAEMNVPPSKKAQMIIVSDHAEDYRLGEHFIKRMAYASELTVTDASPADLTGLVTLVTHGANVYLPLAELVDFEK